MKNYLNFNILFTLMHLSTGLGGLLIAQLSKMVELSMEACAIP